MRSVALVVAALVVAASLALSTRAAPLVTLRRPVVFLAAYGVEGTRRLGASFVPGASASDAWIDESGDRVGTRTAQALSSAFGSVVVVSLKTKRVSEQVERYATARCDKEYAGDCVLWDLTGRRASRPVLPRVTSLADVLAAFEAPMIEGSDCEKYGTAACALSVKACAWQGPNYGCRSRSFRGYATRGACELRKLEWTSGRCV